MTISSLFLECRPPAVFGPVISVAIDAVKRHVFWPFAHIGQEVEETAAFTWIPAITDRNATPSIAGIGCVAGVSAPPEHRNPGPVSRCPGHAVRLNASDVVLVSALGSDSGLNLLRVAIARRAGTADIVPVDEAAGVSLDRALSPISLRGYGGRMSTSTLAQGGAGMWGALNDTPRSIGGFPRQGYMPRQHHGASCPVVMRPLDEASATAGTFNLFAMACQIVRRARTKSIWDRLFAAAFTVPP